MANDPAVPADLRPGDLPLLRAAAVGNGPVSAARARVLLLAAEGRSNTDIARTVGVSRPTVIAWRRRYADGGLAGLVDAPRRARAPRLEGRRIIAATLEAPARRHRAPQWSARLLAAELGVGRSTVSRAWQAHGVRPRGAGTFHFETAPELVAYVTDVVGLVLSPDGCLVALRVHDASGRALNRHAGRDTELASGLAPIAAYAALRAAVEDPAVHALTAPANLSEFLSRARDAHPPYRRRRPDLVLVVHGEELDPALTSWLAWNPSARVHRARDRERWLNLLEAFLTLVELPATRRDAAGCVPELDELARLVVEGRGLQAPFLWTATS